MREFEQWCNGPERVRRDSSAAYDLTGMLISSEGVACSYTEIAVWYAEFQERHGVRQIKHLSRREIQLLVKHGSEKGVVPSGKKIWGIWGLGYVCVEKGIIPGTLSLIDVTIFTKAPTETSGFSVVNGISLLSQAKVKGVSDPSFARVSKAFNTLQVIKRDGWADVLKPLLFGVGRQLVASLANAGGGKVTQAELISRLGRNFIPADSNLIKIKFKDARDVLEALGLGITAEKGYRGSIENNSGYRLHNI